MPMTDTSNTTTETDLVDDVNDPVEIAETKVREPNSYERRLRTERARERQARQAAEQALAAAKTEAETRVVEAHKSAEARIIRAELKALALAAGIVDLDALKMLDLSGLTLGEDGSVAGADALIASAKKAKPYLFGANAVTSNTQPAPKQEPAKEFDARTASQAEIIAFEKKMGLRR